MTFSIFINFNGECREAAAFYAKVFKSEVQDVMTYGEMPPDPSFPISEGDKDRVMYCCVPIFGCNVMFCDNPSDTPGVKGDTITPTLGTADLDEIRRLYRELQVGGQVEMELGPTFWADLFGTVTDKYGITWQLSAEGKEDRVRG
jgi:PhnB protein